MNIAMDTKTAIFLLANLGALALAASGKIDWAHAKEILVWSLGPYIIGQSYENAAKAARDNAREVVKEAIKTATSMTQTSKEEIPVTTSDEKKEDKPAS
jgi:hypothetical protein